MSYGNTNDQSNKGNNSVWQRAQLKLLKAISTSTGAGTTVAYSSSTATVGAGTVTAGAHAVTFTTSTDFSGTINGTARDAGVAYVISATGNNLLPAIGYVVTTGSIIIDKIS